MEFLELFSTAWARDKEIQTGRENTTVDNDQQAETEILGEGYNQQPLKISHIVAEARDEEHIAITLLQRKKG